MSNILKLYKLFFLTLSFVFLVNVSLLLFLKNDPLLFDTQRFNNEITEPEIVIRSADCLRNYRNNIILLGSSNVREGFRPPVIQNYFTDYKIHNAAIGASNVSQLFEIAKFLYSTELHENKATTVWVIGIWFGNFVTNRSRFHDGLTDFGKELERYKLFPLLDGSSGHQSFFGTAFHRKYMRLFDFYSRIGNVVKNWAGSANTEAINTIVDTLSKVKSCLLKGRSGDSKKPQKNSNQSMALDPVFQNTALKFWKNYMDSPGGLHEKEQFEVLVELVNFILCKHDKLILVDMPIPKWFAEKSGYFPGYQKIKQSYLARITAPPLNSSYLNFQDFNNDSDYYDYAHPRKEIADSLWSPYLAKSLLKILSSPK